MSNQTVVLITGASSGVGQSTARLLSQRNYKVFGTSRTPNNTGSIPNVEMLSLDVRRDDSVAACVNDLLSRAGRIDVLVNNAGHELAGAVEELSLNEAHSQFEINFFGVVRMIKAVLPLMRQQRHGQIINVGSLSGLTSIPFLGIYSASKFALEGFTEALRHEVKPFNIHISLIEPAFLKTPMMNNRQVAAEQIREYDLWRQRAFDAIRAYEENAPGPELVAETVLKIMTSDKPRLRYVTGKQARSIARLRRFLPAKYMSRALGVTFGWIRIHEARVKSILRVSRGGFMVIQMNKLKRMSVIGALISLFVIFGAPGTTGQKEANPREGVRNEEWEYLAVAGPGPANLSVDPHMRKEPNVPFGREAFALEQHLDKLGANGWELVAVAGPPTDPAYYFKRRK